jgi:hypothetical protein
VQDTKQRQDARFLFFQAQADEKRRAVLESRLSRPPFF